MMITSGVTGLLFALLLVGHVVGDFLLQSRWIAEGKGRAGPFGVHLLLVAAAHTLFLSPFLDMRVAVVLAGVILVHGVIDAVTSRIRLRADPTRALTIFAVDQALHIVVLVVAWAILAPDVIVPRWIPADAIGVATAGAVLLSAYVFNWNGGSVVVRGVLALVRLTNFADATAAQADPNADEPGQASHSRRVPGTGHIIGLLERFLVLTLVLLGEWGALGLILAAKSIARFKELEDRRFSEYYLLGTLTSVTIAMITGLLVRLLLR